MINRLNFRLRIMLTGLAIGFCMSAKAQPYSTSFGIDEEKAGWQQYRTKYKGTDYKWEFWTFSFTRNGIYETKPGLVHRCNNVSGVPDTIMDWMVSPPLQFSSPSELYVNFYTGGYSSPGAGYHGCKVYFSGGSPDPAMGDYVEIADLTINLPSYSYKWYDTNIHITHTAAKGYIAFVYYIEGNHWFEMSIDSVATTAELVVGISKHEIDMQNSITVFPNPVNNQLIVEIAGQARNDVWNIEIYDIFGRTVLSKEVSNDKTMVDMSNLSSGVYILRVESKDKIVGRKKIIKQ